MRALQATCIAQLEDELETQGTQLKRQKQLTSVQHALLVSSRQEVAWLRDRVCQLQHIQHLERSLSARAHQSAHGSSVMRTCNIP